MSRRAYGKSGGGSDSARAKGRVTLTRADVVAAGSRLLDSEGVEGLSMRKLAGALGTGPATLYWHVRDRAELLALILDEACRAVEVPSEGAWDERLLALMVEARRALSPMPVLLRVLWGAGWDDLGPETLRVADGMIGIVAESGLPEEEVADAYFALIVFLNGFVSAEAMSAGNRGYGEGGETDSPGRGGPASPYPNLERYGPGADPEGMDRRFLRGVSLIIDGIRARAANRSGSPTWADDIRPPG